MPESWTNIKSCIIVDANNS